MLQPLKVNALNLFRVLLIDDKLTTNSLRRSSFEHYTLELFVKNVNALVQGSIVGQLR